MLHPSHLPRDRSRLFWFYLEKWLAIIIGTALLVVVERSEVVASQRVQISYIVSMQVHAIRNRRLGRYREVSRFSNILPCTSDVLKLDL